MHFVGQATWPDAAMLTKVRELVLTHLECHGARDTVHCSLRFPHLRTGDVSPQGARTGL
jgi:hypothetical protein